MRISDLRKNGCFRGYGLPKLLDSSSIYEPLKPFVTSRCESDPVFYVHQGHLPTHMRSLRLSRHTDLEVDRHASSHTCRILLTAAVVALFIVSLLCFFLSVHVWSREDIAESATPPPRVNETSSESRIISESKIKDIFFKSNFSKELKGSPGYTFRQPCVADTCKAYSAFRFKSSCSRGYCRCNGADYQRETCLPKYSDCYIQKNKESFADVYIKGRRPAIYSCQPSPRGITGKLHVISSFGNSQSNETTVEIFGDTENPTPVTIVLSNYHRVKWRVVLKGSHVDKIFLISHHHLRWSSVTVESADTIGPVPPVEKLFSQVGYGEDRYGGHTVNLLKTVNQQIRHISSFTGVASADKWRIDLNRQ